MKQRLATLLAAVALLVVGAAPAIAAPGGVPGPPEGHGRGGDDVVVEDESDVDSKLPSHAKAYGKRLKDYYGIPYGHLQQCAGIADAGDVSEGDEDVDGEEAAEGDEPRKALEACPDAEELVFSEEWQGAKALWILTETGFMVGV